MTEYELALSRLDNIRNSSNGWKTARCPAHDDKRNSLMIKEGDNGKAVLQCLAGCNYVDIIRTLELSKGEKPLARIVAEYNYTDEDGSLLYQVIRYEPKDFRQKTLLDGEWVWKRDKSLSVLYHLPEVLDADEVCICEGEKDVDNLRMIGYTATCIAGGASSQWLPQHSMPLRNKKAILFPDQDTPGKNFMDMIARNIYGWCNSVKVINLPVKDVSDYLEVTEGAEGKLRNIISNAKEYVPVGAVTRDEFNHYKGMLLYHLKSHSDGKFFKKRKSQYD